MRYSVLTGFALVLSIHTAFADKLDDFKEAVKHRGCHSIPYSDDRNICTTQQSDVHSWCDGDRGPVSCTEGTTRNLRDSRNAADAMLTAQRERRRDLESKRSSATDEAEKARLTSEIEQLDREIEATVRRLEDSRNELSKRKDLVEKTMYTINRCLDFRRAVMNVFGHVTDKVRGENDPDIKPYAQTLRDKYFAERGQHEGAIQEKTTSLERCKSEVP